MARVACMVVGSHSQAGPPDEVRHTYPTIFNFWVTCAGSLTALLPVVSVPLEANSRLFRAAYSPEMFMS